MRPNEIVIKDEQRFDPKHPIQMSMMKRIAIEMALARGAYDQTVTLCQSSARELRMFGRPRSSTRLGILKSIALIERGDHSAGHRNMIETMRLARPNQLVSGFHELRHFCMPIITDIKASRQTEHTALMQAPEDWLLSLLDTSDKPQVDAPSVPRETAMHDLTKRECELLDLAAMGCTNAEIAAQFVISVPTVKWHFHNAYQKLGVRNRTGALLKARRLGLLSSPQL